MRLPLLLTVFVLLAAPVTASETPTSVAAISTPATSSTPVVPSASGSYLAGRYAQMQGDWNNAADYAVAAFESDPQNPFLAQRAFMTLLAAGNVERALAMGDKLPPKSAEQGVWKLMTALDNLRTEKYATAKTALKNLPDEGLNRLIVPIMLAWSEEGLKNDSGALAALAPLAKRENTRDIRDFHAALILDAAGRTREAEPLYREMAKDTFSLRDMLLLGSFFERTGDKKEAESTYRKMDEQEPDNAVSFMVLERLKEGRPSQDRIIKPAQAAALVLSDLSGIWMQNNAPELALVYIHMALYLDPDSALSHIIAGDYLMEMDRPDKAAEEYARVPATSDLSWMAGLRQTNALETAGKTDEAIRLLNTMADAQPTRIEAVLQLADLLRREEKFTDALSAYDRVVERIGKPEARHWSIFYARGMSAERAGNWDRAEADFKKALALEPDQPLVLNYLGYSWVDQGKNIAEAQKMLEKALELAPNEGAIVDSYGWALFKQGQFKEATKYLERAAELAPGDATVNDHLGDAYWKTDRKREALFQWNHALTFATDDPKLAETIRKKLETGLEGK